jgi:F-type H+-transporting ATPase subunit epsilon
LESELTLKVVTPNEIYFEGPVVSVVAPGARGYLGILRNHAPFMTTVSQGKLTYRDEYGNTKSFGVEGGFLEVRKNRILVLTDKIV